MKQPEQNKVDIAVNKTNIINMKDDICFIKSQVSNHIPTALREIRDLITKSNEDSDRKIQVLKDFVNSSNKEQDNKIALMEKEQRQRDAEQNKEQWLLAGKVSIVVTIVLSIVMSIINKVL